MEVDLTAPRALQDDPRREPWACVRGSREAEAGEGAARPVALGPLHDEIEVGVHSRLLPDERVHAPPAVDPRPNPLCLEAVEDLQDFPSSHDVWLLPARFVKGTVP